MIWSHVTDLLVLENLYMCMGVLWPPWLKLVHKYIEIDKDCCKLYIHNINSSLKSCNFLKLPSRLYILDYFKLRWQKHRGVRSDNDMHSICITKQ